MIRILVVPLVATLLFAGCFDMAEGGADDPRVQAAAEDLVASLELEDVNGPRTTNSKSIYYLTANGTAPGSSPEVRARVLRVLQQKGWEIREKHERGFVANRGGVATNIGVYQFEDDLVRGTSTVQLAVATPTRGLEWANP